MNTKFIAFITIFVVSSMVSRASLEDILAPLPIFAETTAVVSDRDFGSMETDNTVAVDDTQSETPVAVSSESADEMDANSSSGVAYPISNERLLSEIEEQLHAHLRTSGNISLSPMRPLPDLSRHSEPFQVKLSRLPGRLTKNTVYLSVEVQNDEGVVGKWDIPFRPALYSEVWVAKKYLREGDLAAISDFEVRQIDLLYEPESVVATREVLQQREYSRDIRPGQPLMWTDLIERSLVRKGQVVDVIAYQGMIGITMRAKAQQDGVHGDVVFLRNLESNKNFTGEVIGDGRVQVTF